MYLSFRLLDVARGSGRGENQRSFVLLLDIWFLHIVVLIFGLPLLGCIARGHGRFPLWPRLLDPLLSFLISITFNVCFA